MRELTVAKKSAGIDIGSHSLKAVILSKKGTSAVINSFSEVPIPRSGPAKPEQLGEALEELCRRLKVGSAVAVTCISTQQTTVRNLEIPFSEEEKARQILKFQTEPYLAYPIEEVIIDFYNTQTAPEGRMKVLLTAIHKGVIGQHLELLSRGKIEPEVVDVDFMAISSTVLRAEPRLREGSATLLDMGASKTIACHIQEGRLRAVRCITLGGDDFTDAISKELGVSFEEAERIKVGVGAGDDSVGDAAERVRLAVAPVLNRLGAELDRTVRYFSSQVKGGSFDKVILSGGSASLPGLDRFLTEALSAEVSVVSPSDTIKNGSQEEIPFHRFATAIGLALRGVGESLCLQNFRQEDHAYPRPFRRLRKSIVAAGALAFAIASLLVFSLFSSIDRYADRRSYLNFLIQTKRSTIFPGKAATTLVHMRDLLGQEEDKLMPFRELGRNVSLLEVLNDLSTRILKEMKVEVDLFRYTKTALPKESGSRQRGRSTSKTPTWAGTVTLEGSASSFSETVDLERILKESPYVGDVERKGRVSQTTGGRVKFGFSLKLKEARS